MSSGALSSAPASALPLTSPLWAPHWMSCCDLLTSLSSSSLTSCQQLIKLPAPCGEPPGLLCWPLPWGALASLPSLPFISRFSLWVNPRELGVAIFPPIPNAEAPLSSLYYIRDELNSNFLVVHSLSVSLHCPFPSRGICSLLVVLGHITTCSYKDVMNSQHISHISRPFHFFLLPLHWSPLLYCFLSICMPYGHNWFCGSI